MHEQQIESLINEYLADDAKQNALDFVAFLRAQDMQFERSVTDYWCDKLYWYVKYKKRICRLYSNQ